MTNSAVPSLRARYEGRSLFRALLDAGRRHGGRSPIVEDVEGKPLSYRRLVLGSVMLGRRLAALSVPGEHIGILLPNATGTLVAVLGLLAFRRVPAMLNVSAGAESMISACAAADIRTVLSSRQFIAHARLEAVVQRMSGTVRVVLLEDLHVGSGTMPKVLGLRDTGFARRLPGAVAHPDTAAAILFTSGSEGAPKAVVLSHRNILANCNQLASVVDFDRSDRVLNAMPMFHAFGFTGGTILPVLSGVRTFLYPSPLHYRLIPGFVHKAGATILFGTDTFLMGWGRSAQPHEFQKVRLAFAGAERVREETRRLYEDRFGVRVLEGYGATETAPVIAINTARHNRPGTVGQFLPGIEWRLDPVPGIADGGRLLVRGANVMLGYMKASAPGVLEPLEDGWYDTGDIVDVDEDGFITIKGRLKRFAKLAGEMVSMTAAESLAAGLWPDAVHAVVSRPDPRKGEQLVLVTTQRDASASALLAYARRRSIAELLVPRVTTVIEAMPLLGTGKIDYGAVHRLASAATNAQEVA